MAEKKAKKEQVSQVTIQADEKVNVLQLCAELVKGEGVEHYASLIGGNIGTFDTTLQMNGLKRVHVRHEQAAGFFMDAWGRLSRRPGFACVGPGTGTTNATTGVVQAHSAGAPGVMVVAESYSMDDDKFGSQGLARVENQFKGISKWTRRVPYPANLLFQLKRAFRSAVIPPTGPCVVGYPNEIAGSEAVIPRSVAYTNYTPGYLPPTEFKTQADPQLVEQLLKWLMAAERPVIMIGHCAHQDNCQEAMREFVHLLGIPAIARRTARGMISEEDPLHFGPDIRRKVMGEADRCIVFGLRIGYLENFGQPPYFPATIRYAQVHNTPDITDLGLPTDIEVIGNLQAVLKQMIQAAKDMGTKAPVAKWKKWRQFIVDTSQAYKTKHDATTDKYVGKKPLHPDLLGRYIAEFLTEKYNNDYITIIDGFTASSYFTNWNVCVNSGTTLDASETIGMGHAPGMALAAGLYTKRQKPIIAIFGDGAMGAGGMDIETNARWGIPAVFIHENNNVLVANMFETWYAKACSPTGNMLRDSWQVTPNVRYDKVFAEMGCHTEFVESSEQVKPALERAVAISLKEQKTSFVECFVDPHAMHSMMMNPFFMPMLAGTLHWDDLPEQGKKHASSMAIPAIMPMLTDSWREGIAAYQKK